MDILNGKLAKSHARRLEQGKEMGTLRKKLNLFLNNAIRTNYVNAKKIDKPNEMATRSYVII